MDGYLDLQQVWRVLHIVFDTLFLLPNVIVIYTPVC
jgi:hypothetical protein